MAYDEQLAERIRTTLVETEEVEERQMFGGIAFLHHGNMVCGVVGETLSCVSAPIAPRARSTSRTRGRWTSPADR